MVDSNKAQRLVDEINQMLEHGSGSLTSVLRKATRLAELWGDHEYRIMFDLHLKGVDPKNLDKTQLPQWPSKDLHPRWNVLLAFGNDRSTGDGNIQANAIESLEMQSAMLQEAMTKATAEKDFAGAAKFMEMLIPLNAIQVRIRNRVGSFVRSIEMSSQTVVIGEADAKNLAATPVVFIGHGNSVAWKDLRDFVTNRLNLSYEEFNREPPAGKSTKERLAEMLDRGDFAFLIMTAEDEHADKTVHARANVIHEVGLFQGRLGFNKAIVLLEQGCEEFSNIRGLTQIRFPKGDIMAVAEEIRRVLEREGLILGAAQSGSGEE
ncbi:MAG: TIR domain-containing protein [Acidobacteriota bacterium]